MYEEKHYGTWETLIVPDRRKVIPVFLCKKKVKRSEPALSEIPALNGTSRCSMSLPKWQRHKHKYKDGSGEISGKPDRVKREAG